LSGAPTLRINERDVVSTSTTGYQIVVCVLGTCCSELSQICVKEIIPYRFRHSEVTAAAQTALSAGGHDGAKFKAFGRLHGQQRPVR
jgi:hypothetical protein